MDPKALEYTKEHYNRHAGQFKDTSDALQARAQGPSAPLKKFHNTIKRRLIDRFARDADSLLDLACGRGGDIIKWFDAGIRFVKGIDLSPGEVAEARQRYDKVRAERRGGATTCEFVDTPLLGLQEWREPRQYDAVTCMFALHYFCAAEAALKQFLSNVSANLKPGGHFFGTVPDGRRVNECIRAGRVFSSPMLRIEAQWVGQPAPFGSAYLCAIGDTVTSSEMDTAGSLEYLVYGSVLAKVAAQYDLLPVLDYQDASLEALLERADDKKLLKHFSPNFPGSDPSLARASELFATFVFRKAGVAREAAELAPEAAPVGHGGGGSGGPPGQQAEGGRGAKRGRGDGGGDEACGAAEGQAQLGSWDAGGDAGEAKNAASRAPSYKRPAPRRRTGAASQQAAADAAGSGNSQNGPSDAAGEAPAVGAAEEPPRLPPARAP